MDSHTTKKRTLNDYLDADSSSMLEDNSPEPSSASLNDDLDAEAKSAEGFCVECGDQPACLLCETCGDEYCEVCFAAQHRKGKRKLHTTKPIASALLNQQRSGSQASSSSAANKDAMESDSNSQDSAALDVDSFVQRTPAPQNAYGGVFLERAKFIPLRLAYEERRYLRLLEATLHVSEYTDKVDIITYGRKADRIHHQIRDICAILSGLLVASDYKAGQELIKDRDFKLNETYFQAIFEIGRRHKIMNPEKMRTEYGKLIYMLQDSVKPDVQDLLEFSCVEPIKVVYDFLKDHNGLDVLNDEYVTLATMEIIGDGKPRHVVQHEIRQKERAIEYLARRYAKPGQLSQDQIKTCLYSIGDNNAFLRVTRDPCDKMIEYLTTYFSPTSLEPGYSLAIVAGRSGARLTHSHATQYHYCLQSLTLWREILNDFFKLWCLAESDLLDERNYYRLSDTGQGLNRVQAAPRIGKAMHNILHTVQRKLANNGVGWVGSSVIHLGDHNVPNALMFIDKYTQVSRILNPIVIALRQLDTIQDNPGIKKYIDQSFGGVEKLKKDILCDFFQHAFDGSGADNFFDAGSCIDGRLTSAWHWCSQVEKKHYFPVLLLTGFVGFDGEF